MKGKIFMGALASLSLFVMFSACDIGLGGAVDTEAPTGSITSPGVNAVIRDAFAIKGTWKDDGSVGQITVALRNTTTNATNTYNAKVESDGTWLCAVNPADSAQPLVDGTYLATVTLYDNGGHTNTLSHSYIIDNTAPVVILSYLKSKDDSATEIKTYGKLFTLSGKAADDNNINRIDIKVYQDPACGTELKTITKLNVPAAIEQDVATFGSDDYTAIYGSADLAGSVSRYCKVFAYDDAQRYPVDGSAQSDSDKLGNCQTSYYFQTTIEKLGYDKYKTNDLYAMFNGTYSNPTQDSSRAVLSADEIAAVKKALTDSAVQVGTFALNPKNNPTFTVIGLNQALPEGETMYDETTSEAKTLYTVTNGDADSGIPLTITLTPGRDNYAIDNSSIKMYFQECSKTGEIIETAEKIIIPNENNSTSIKTKPISTQNFAGLKTDKYYRVCVEGADTKGNAVEPDISGVYAFNLAPTNGVIELNITKSPEYVSSNYDANAVNKALNVILKYSYTGSEELKLYREFDVAPTENAEPIGGVTLTKAVDTTYIDSIPVTELSGHTKVYYTLKNESKSSYSRSRYVDISFDNDVPEITSVKTPEPSETSENSFRFEGTASDSASGLNSIEVRIYDASDETKKYTTSLAGTESWSFTVIRNDKFRDVAAPAYGGVFLKDGLKKIEVQAVDGVGLKSALVVKEWHYKSTKPLFELTGYTPVSGAKIDKTVNLLSIDGSFAIGKAFALSGTISDEYGIDTVTCSRGTVTLNDTKTEWTLEENEMPDVGQTATYEYVFTIKDAAGIEYRTKKLTVSIDRKAPEIKEITLPGTKAFGDDSLSGGSYIFKGTAIDESPSIGMKAVRYAITEQNATPDSNTVWTDASLSGENWSITKSLGTGTDGSDINTLYEGKYTLHVKAVDNADNESDLTDATKRSFCVDQKAPKVEVKFYKGSLTSPLDPRADGTYIITDDDIANFRFEVIASDANKISKIIVKEASTTGSKSYIDSKSVTLSSSDTDLSVFNLGEEKTYNFEFEVEDDSGNNLLTPVISGKKASVKKTIIFDKHKPEIKIMNGENEADRTATAKSYWFTGTGKAYITGTASDVGSGIKKMEISFDNGSNWETIPTSAEWTYQHSLGSIAESTDEDDSYHTINVRITDNAGNINDNNGMIYYFRYDSGAPKLTARTDNDSVNATGTVKISGDVYDGANLAANRPVKELTLTATKDGVAYTLPNGSYTRTLSGTSLHGNYSYTIDGSKLTEEGLYTFIVTAKDYAGLEISKDVNITFDKTPPKITKLTADVDITSASDNSKDSNGTKWYGKLTHSIIVSANDGTGSGIDKVEWCTALAAGSDSGAEWQPLNKKTTGSETYYNGSIIFAENASSGSKLYIRATDKAGNITKFNTKVSSTDPNSAIDYIVFNIDVTAPALKQGFYSIEGINGIETAGGTAYVNGSKKLTLYGSYEDGQSGIKELKDKFKLKGISVTSVEVKYSTGIIGTETITELTASNCTQLTFENYVEADSTKYKYWKAEFTPAVTAGDTAKLTVQGQNHANLSTDEITIVSIVKDTEAPKIVSGNTFFETDSSVNRVYNSNSKYYVNNKNQTFTLRGISTDDFVLSTVTLEGENKQTFKKSDGTDVTKSKTASNWRFEGIDLSGLSNGDKVKIYVVVTDMAGNQNVTRDTNGNITGSTDGLFEIVIDSTPPIGKHLQDGKGKDIYFRIGDAKNDDNENVTDGDGKYNEDLDNKAGSKYSADSYGNKKNIEIRGLFDDGNIFDSTKDVSGIKTIYYRVYKKSDYTPSVQNLLAKVTGKTEDEFKSVYKDYKDFAEDIQKNHTGEITPLSSISEKRVFFTNRTFSTSEAQNLNIAGSITDKDGNTKHWAKIKSNYNEKLTGFDEENNYLVLVAEDNVGNIAVDCARLSNGDIYNNFSLNVDTHAPILMNYTSSAEFTNASDSATGKLRNGDVVLTGTVADYLNGATSLTDTVSELKSLTIKVGETDNKIEFKIKSEEETGSIVQNYYIKDTKDTELKNASEDISSYANKLTTNRNASDTLAVRKWKATIPGSYFTGLSGNVVIYAIAEDNAGNEKKETAANIIVDKDPPTVTLNKPSNVIGDKTVNGKITLKGTTEDSYLTVDSGTDKTLVLYYTTKSDATIGDTFTSGDDAATGWKLLDSKQHASSFEFTNIDTTTLAADQTPVFFIVRATDKAGNIGYSNKLELIVDQDTDRPEITIKNLPLVSMTSSGVWAKNNQLFGTVNDDDGISAVYVMRKNPSDAEPSVSDEWGDNLLNGGIWQYTIPKDGPGVFYFKVVDNQTPANTYISSSTKTLQSTPKIYDNQSTPNKYGIRGGTTDSRVYLKVDTKKPEIRNVFYKTSDSTTTTMTVSADAISKMLSDSTTPSGWTILTSAGITNYIGGTKSKYLWILYDFLDDNGIKEIETEKIKKDTKEVNGLSTADFTPTENSDPTYRLIKFDLSSLNSGDNKLSLSVKDQADSSSEPKEYTIKIDNTAPAVEIRKPEGNSDQYGSLAVSASGTVSVDYDNVLIQDFFFALTADDEKPSVSSTVWTNVTDCVGLGKWNILFDKNDGEELGLASDGYYHAKKLNEYIKTLYSSEFTGTEDINKPVYLWVYSVDSLGNTDYDSAKKVQFTVYTQADKPTVKIEYPDSTATTLAGMIRISGIAEIRAEKVDSVWLKIDPNYNGSEFNDSGWEAKLIELNSAYTVADSGNTEIGRGIKADGTTSWHYTINSRNEFGKINGQNRKVAVKAYALSNTNKASVLETVTFTINPDKPQIKSAGTSNDNVLMLINKTDTTKKMQYEENMWISGEWYIEGSVRHGAGIYLFTYTEAGKEEGIDLIDTKTLIPTGLGNVTLTERSDIMDDGATAKNWDFKIPVGAYGDDKAGTNEFTIRIQDNGSKASDEKTIKIRYDNKVPSGFTAKTISGAISSTNKDFRNSNGKFALSGEIKENEAAGESGVKRIAFYFTREAKADSSSTTKTTYFIDPLITKVKSGATSEPEKFRNNYIDLSASDTGITPGSDGLYWYEVSDVSVADKNITFDSSKLMSESSRELYKLWDGNIRKGGLCKMNNAVYTIKEKTTESGKIKLTLDSAPASADKAYFALAQVIDNTSVETGTTGTYSDSDTMVNQDGDCMQEGLTGVGGNYEWQASINSTNLYDGPVKLHFVYYDKAGNSSHVSYDGMICNNVPRIASVTVKSDYDGSESFTHTDAAGKTVADEDEISTYYPGGSTTVSNVLKAVKAVTGTVIVSSDGKTTGSAYKTLKDKSEIAVEMVGGNGMLHYQYAIGNTAGSNTIKNGEVSDWATGSEDNYDDNYAYVAASHIHSIELPVTFFTESGKEVPNNTASNPITWFQYIIWDDTDGTTKFVDSQNVTIQIALDVQVTDAIKPNVVIDKFKWNSTRDNSLYGGSSANGHIELESDLPSGIFTGTSGEYDKDPKVSGKIVLRGYVYDNKRLKNIQIAIPKSSVLTKTTTVAIYDNTTKIWKDSDTTGDVTGLTKGTMADNGWRFTVSNAKSGGAYFDGSGHKVMWTFEYDTEKVTGIAATDVNVTITANDSASLASTSRTASEVDSDETKHRPSYQMDVVPYVTSVIRDSTRYNENRARSGAVALLRGEGSNKISGFNLGNLTNSSISIVPNKNGSGTGTEMTSPALADSDRSITFTVPETAETGYLHVVVNGVAALNNMNGYVDYNTETNAKAFDHNTLTDDRYVHIWRVTNKDTFKGSKNAVYPSMASGSDGTLYASFTNYGESKVYYTKSFTGGGEVYASDYTGTTNKLANDAIQTSSGKKNGVATIFFGYDPPEETSICIGPNDEINVLFAANYHGGNDDAWKWYSGSDAGGLYVYDTHAGDMNVQSGTKRSKVYRTELYTYDDELNQFRNARLTRTENYIYAAYYDRLTGAIKTCIINDGETGTEARPDTRAGALPWITLDGGYDGLDNGSATYGTVKFLNYENPNNHGSFSSPTYNNVYGVTYNSGSGNYHYVFAPFTNEGSPWIPFLNTNYEGGLSRTSGTGESVSITTNPSGYPVVFYMDATTGQPRIARASSVYPNTTSDWHVQGVFASSDVNYRTASDYMTCKIDSDGYLHIAFQNTKGQLVYAKSTNNPSDGTTAYTFGASQVIDDSGMWIDITMNGKTPYISYLSRVNSYEGMKLAFWDSTFDENNDGVGEGGWEIMTAAMDQKVTNVRTCIAPNAKAYDGNQYTAAIGFCPGLDYRAAFYVGK